MSIGDELNNMQSYLSIQLMMHDDSFDTCIEVPEEMKQYASLNLLLQPLVENAIDHGIDLKENGRGEIAITGKMEDNDIYLYVI